MNHERPAPPLAVELGRPVLLACRRDPSLTSTINGVLLRAARRLRALMDTDGSVRVAGRAEGVILELRLTPPDRCRVEAVHTRPPDGTIDLIV